MRTLSEMLTDLRLDLKDSGTVWSDAELTRCVERAVSDLSRFLPREAVYEVTVDSEVSSESFTTPTVADPDYIVDNEDISDVTDGETCTLVTGHGALDVPRPVTILITEGSTTISAFTIIVKGTDADGNYIEESFYFSGGLSQTGNKHFNTVTEVELDRFVGEGASDVLDVGTSNAYDVYVQLANKPIKRGSETISGESRDTDYIMDYTNGRIKFTDAGDMVANTAYTIAYTKSQVHVDLAPISQELIKVDRVEYPVGNVPQVHSTSEIWGNVLTVTGDVEGQASFSDAEHLAIYYLAMHRAPSNDAPGSYPPVLEDTVVLAASAYALFIEALQYEHQAVADMTLVTDYINEAHTQIGNVSKYLFDNSGDDAASILETITDNIAELRTKIESAVGNASTYLGAVSTTDLDAATVGAVAWLLEGELLINTVNVGDRVPENFMGYAATKVSIANSRINAALGYIQEAVTRLVDLRSYIEESAGWVAIADRFIADTQQRLAMAETHIAEASGMATLAERYRAEAIERRNEAWSIWRDPKSYIGDYSISPTYQTGI